MRKTEINGIPCDSYGINNYSYGMELIVFNPKDISIEDVLKLDNVWLNPTAKANDLEIFAVKGTVQQYHSMLIGQRKSQAVQKAYDRIGHFEFDIELQPEFIEWTPWFGETHLSYLTDEKGMKAYNELFSLSN